MKRVAIVMALALCAGSARAQEARFDTALVRTLTVASLLQAAVVEVEVSGLRSSGTTVAAMVDRLVARLNRPAVTQLPLNVVANAVEYTTDGRRAGFGQVARANRQGVASGLGSGDAADLDTLARLMPAELRFAMENRQPPVPDDSVDLILEPLTALNTARLGVSLAMSVEKLNRFERKYGPDAPRLNAAEVLLNFAAQWVPLFQPNDEGWPSRWEVVAAYVPGYLTMVSERATTVTVAELGLRAYIWKRGWGSDGGGALRPGYVTFGVALAGEGDGSFVSPLQGDSRIGAFIGWGGAKVAWVGGSRSRVMFTRQVQLVPWVF
jgi:hypothetical protein